ncbi:hypothetical protein RSal33209_0010 [Renibacterium salmoninarum ATCC 33209]|uniref:Uncharacterized protein n=1 Tax=Renibacterium salmoninarum (strain ATCC 33209 / DSM 20767 / JCM 11484 / NBRC 15589 / NCIMB 2235) TaxID=288705 RepID=A9WR37_RENSM|nr:DLW-39 family protein [Renibacterium salmoninarum]ABY21769.1 hypothetical protein RSal33209_0010 [Renibacterium salmoninarum ATCC 33209]
MKKLIVIAAAIAGAVFLRKKMQVSKQQKNVWNQETDKVD